MFLIYIDYLNVNHPPKHCQAMHNLESRIKKMTETFTSGIELLKEHGNSMQKKASSDLELISSKISSQRLTIEQV